MGKWSTEHDTAVTLRKRFICTKSREAILSRYDYTVRSWPDERSMCVIMEVLTTHTTEALGRFRLPSTSWYLWLLGQPHINSNDQVRSDQGRSLRD